MRIYDCNWNNKILAMIRVGRDEIEIIVKKGHQHTFFKLLYRIISFGSYMAIRSDSWLLREFSLPNPKDKLPKNEDNPLTELELYVLC